MGGNKVKMTYIDDQRNECRAELDGLAAKFYYFKERFYNTQQYHPDFKEKYSELYGWMNHIQSELQKMRTDDRWE